MEALVSIITPIYNSEAYISETITSVINQSYKNWELILIDDGSSDSTLMIIQPFLDKYPQITLIKNYKNQGAAMSRNKGIEAAQGDYMAFLDADDLWKPNKLEVQIQFMKRNRCAVSFSSYECIAEGGLPLHKRVVALKTLSYNKLLKSNYIGNLTGVYHAKTLGKITSPNLRKRQDWLLWLAAIKQSGKPALGISEVLASYRVRKNGISSNKLELIKHNYWVYQKGLGFSSLKSCLYMLIFLKEHFFVKSRLIQTLRK